jgi:hypothetical protein
MLPIRRDGQQLWRVQTDPRFLLCQFMYSFNSSINAMSSSLSIGTDFKQSSATFAGTNASVASGLKDIYALDMELTDEHGEPLDCATTALLFSSKAALRASNSKSIATTM